MDNIWNYFGILVLVAGVMDAFKYSFLTAKIKRLASSRGISRQFNNVAVFHKIVLSIWATFYLKDWAVASATLIALITSIELWIVTFRYYPFQGRGRFGYQRPSLLKYIWNSLLPNKIAGKI